MFHVICAIYSIASNNTIIVMFYNYIHSTKHLSVHPKNKIIIKLLYKMVWHFYCFVTEISYSWQNLKKGNRVQHVFCVTGNLLQFSSFSRNSLKWKPLEMGRKSFRKKSETLECWYMYLDCLYYRLYSVSTIWSFRHWHSTRYLAIGISSI